jgi:hypothetical protein
MPQKDLRCPDHPSPLYKLLDGLIQKTMFLHSPGSNPTSARQFSHDCCCSPFTHFAKPGAHLAMQSEHIASSCKHFDTFREHIRRFPDHILSQSDHSPFAKRSLTHAK